MIIWKGRGILIALFAIAGIIPGVMLDSINLSLWGAAGMVWLFALTLGKPSEQTFLDPQTHQPVVLRRSHTLYFIPPKAWAVVLTLFAAFLTFGPRDTAGENVPEGAKAMFEAADATIRSNKGGATAHGNSPQATDAARRFATGIETLRDVLIEKSRSSSVSLTDGAFLTYAHVTPSQCIFLVHVPQLRKFTKEAKEAMADAAWLTAHSVAATLNPKPERIAVGIRGAVLYERARIGHLAADSADPAAGVDREVEGNDARDALAELFPEAGGVETPADDAAPAEAPSAPSPPPAAPAVPEGKAAS